MRKIIIPQEAIDRHEATLGRALMGYLKCLAGGQTVRWVKDGRQSYQATTWEEKRYWNWVLAEFTDKDFISARPGILLAFAKKNTERFGLIDPRSKKCLSKRQKSMLAVTQALFNFGAFRSGAVLAPCASTCRTIQWVTLPLIRPRKRNKRYLANKAVVDAWKGWSLAEFVRLLDVRYCPYCNAETVGVVYAESPSEKNSFSALDHILPKSDYPLLALSLYNLVPACYRCNSQFKGEKDGFDLEHWDASEPFKALHPYAHNIYKWFRFDYRPTAVEHLFLKPRDKDSPLTVTRRIPLKKGGRKKSSAFYLERVGKHLEEYRLLNAYRDLYAMEINAILKMEMICTPTFVALMRGRYPYLADEDFNLVFRRASLVPDEINYHRFGKLIIDLNRQIGDGGLFAALQNEKGVQVDLKAIDAAWEARKCVIEERVRERFAL